MRSEHYLCKLCHRLILSLLLRNRVQFLGKLRARFGVDDDELPIGKWAEVELGIAINVLRCMVRQQKSGNGRFSTKDVDKTGEYSTSRAWLDSQRGLPIAPGMKMQLRVCSECSLKMLFVRFKVATSVPQATASEDNVSTWLCSCRCLTNADLSIVLTLTQLVISGVTHAAIFRWSTHACGMSALDMHAVEGTCTIHQQCRQVARPAKNAVQAPALLEGSQSGRIAHLSPLAAYSLKNGVRSPDCCSALHCRIPLHAAPEGIVFHNELAQASSPGR